MTNTIIRAIVTEIRVILASVPTSSCILSVKWWFVMVWKNALQTMELFFLKWTKNIHSNSYFSIRSKLELKVFSPFSLTLGEIFAVMSGFTVSWLDKCKFQIAPVLVSRSNSWLFLRLSFSIYSVPSVGYLRVLHHKLEKAWKARSWLALSWMVSSHFCLTDSPDFSCAMGWEENGIH